MAGMFRSVEKSNDLFGNVTRDLSAFSIMTLTNYATAYTQASGNSRFVFWSYLVRISIRTQDILINVFGDFVILSKSMSG
jgi:hypothetical protein